MNNKLPKKLLIIDDDPVDTAFLSSILETENYQVRTALNTKKAFDILKTDLPDLILLDVKLPDMDGFEFCQQLKAIDKYQDILVIFVSMLEETVDKVKGLQVGGIDYLVKPIVPEEMLMRIKTYMTVCFMQKKLKQRNQRLEQEIIARQQSEQALQKIQQDLEQRVQERTKELASTNQALRQEIEERKRMEKALQQAHSELERRVEERTAALKQTNQQLEQEIAERKCTEETLRLYEHIVSMTDEHMSFIDTNYVYQAVNEAYLKAHDKTQTEIVGHTVAELLTPTVFETTVKSRLDRCLTGQKVNYQIWFNFAGLGLRYVDVSFHPFFELDGIVSGVVAKICDITEQQRTLEALKDSEEKWRSITENSPDHIALIKPDAKILFINRTVPDLTREEVIGKTLYDYTPPQFHEAVRRCFKQVVETGKLGNYFTEYHTKKGDIQFFEVRVGPIFRDKQVVAMTVRSTNITDRIQAENALKESEEWFRNLFDAGPIALLVADIEGKPSRINQKAIELFGIVEPKEIMLLNLFQKAMLPTNILKKLGMGKTVRFASPFNFELIKKYQLYQTNRSGNLFLDITITPIHLSNSPSFKGYLCHAADITKLKQSEIRYRELFLNISSGVAVYDVKNQGKDFIFKDINRASEKIDRINKREIISQSVVKIFPGVKNFGLFNVFQRVWQTGKPEHYPISLYQDDRMTGWRENYVYKLPSGELVAVYDDVTQRKQDEEALKKAHNELKQRVNELAEARKQAIYIMGDLEIAKKQAERAKEDAERANQAKSDFLANMSHEIRTPMNAILCLTQLALKTPLSDKQRHYLTQIEFSSQTLLRIINEILDFSKIEAGKLNLEFINFHLNNVLGKIFNLLDMKSQEKGLEFLIATNIDVPVYLIGDPLRLEQILVNLSTNAIKFTEQGEIVIRVELMHLETQQVTLRFSVQDTGIGLSAEAISHLFDAFTQANGSTTRKFGGTGLGLTICKRLVKMMGGDIWVDSKLGKGSTFSFTAHFGCQTEPMEKKFLLPLDMRGLRVLIVDDNNTSREILQNQLSAFSFEFSSVNSGHAALTTLVAANPPYDLVMLDYDMPQMDGVETAISIKQDSLIPKQPMIILVTTLSQIDMLNQENQAMFDAFVIKPVFPSSLFDTIMEVFGKPVANPSPRLYRQQTSISPDFLSDIKGARILLVEDNTINQQVAHEILEMAGMEVSIAKNGRESVAIISTSIKDKNHFDAILMDVQMPEMDGYEACRLIKDEPQSSELPIIAMTAHAMAGDREKCLAAGMDDYVTKPIDIEQLCAVLKKWIKIKPPSITSVESPSSLSPVKETPDARLVWPDELPGISIQSALKRLGGNQQLLKRLLTDFYQDYRTVTNDLSDMLRCSDLKAAQKLAHTIKGVAGNISAHSLQKTARELEKALKIQADDIPVFLEQFDSALVQLLKTIQILELDDNFSETKAPNQREQSAQLDVSAIAPLLIELAERIKKNRVNAEESLETVKTHLDGFGFAEELKQLEDCLSQFDFKGAQMPLKEIAKRLEINEMI